MVGYFRLQLILNFPRCLYPLSCRLPYTLFLSLFVSINNTNLLYEDSDTSMIHVNFSRYKEDDSVLTTHDFSYLLVADDVDWKIKAAFSAGEIVLANID